MNSEELIIEIRKELDYAYKKHQNQSFTGISIVKNIAIRKLLEYNTQEHMYKPSCIMFNEFQEEINCILACIAILMRGVINLSEKNEYVCPTQKEMINDLIKKRQEYFKGEK